MTEQKPDEPRYAAARRQFESEIGEHELTIFHDDGVYRHIRLAKPGTGIWHWDIITWPGHLATAGDIADGYQFARIHDMFDFFHRIEEPWRINPTYWHEKMPADLRAGATKFSPEKFEAHVRERVAEMDDLTEAERTELLDALGDEVFGIEDYAASVQALEGGWAVGDGKRVEFTDTWDDGPFEDWDHHFLLALFAIVWGIEKYRAHTAAAAAATTEGAAA
jgi:hypothetical protein